MLFWGKRITFYHLAIPKSKLEGITSVIARIKYRSISECPLQHSRSFSWMTKLWKQNATGKVSKSSFEANMTNKPAKQSNKGHKLLGSLCHDGSHFLCKASQLVHVKRDTALNNYHNWFMIRLPWKWGVCIVHLDIVVHKVIVRNSVKVTVR